MSEEVKIPLPRSLQEIVGSLLFASETPLTANDLRNAVKAVEPEEGENAEVMDVYRTCTGREIDAAIKGVAKALEVAGCGFQLVCTGGTYRLQTSPSCGRYVRALLKLDRPNRLGRASLETLAIVAYRQPLTKGEIEEIRGVDVSANIKTLMDLQLIRLVGKSELPGHPFLYGTTPLFLEHFGLASLQQLNELDPTLQRSNPREKAASYRKPAAPEAAGQPAEGAAAEGDGAKAPPETPPEASADAPEAEGDGVRIEVVEREVYDDGEGEDGDGTGSAAAAPADDDVFIDDTPDEFDDDEDDDEDVDDDDDDVEEDGEEEGDDETRSGDGGDSPDGVDGV